MNLPNHYNYFQNSGAFVTGLPDFHNLDICVHKIFIIKYWDCVKFGNDKVTAELVKELSFKRILQNQFEKFIDITQNVLNKLALIKQEHLRNNESAFMTISF